MASKVKRFVSAQAQALAGQADKLRKVPGKAMRDAAAVSAKRVRALQEPMRAVTHSGVRLTSVSHEALLSLMALQLDVVTSALADAATQLERLAQSDNVSDLVRGQADELRAVRARVVSDVSRAVAIVQDAGRGVREVATDTYNRVARPAANAKAARARNAKRPRRTSQVKAKARTKSKKKAPTKQRAR